MIRIYIALALSIAIAGAFLWARWDAVRDDRTKNLINDQKGALTVHEKADEANSGIGGDTDPDSLLRETDGLRR